MKQFKLRVGIRTKMVLLNCCLLAIAGLLLVFGYAWIDDQQSATMLALILFVGGTAGTFLIGTNMARDITRMTDVAKNIADGDLKYTKIDPGRSDEVGEMGVVLENMVMNLGSMMGQITETSLNVNSSSNQILATLKRQESNSNEQASAVEEIKRTMTSLLESSKQIAESTQAVFANTERTLENNRLITGRIEQLNEHTQRITETLEAIKDIADKSDLLALNAALEGTKAGEAGRGFSLVAGEMRRLAEDVMGSVKNIKLLVSDIRKSSHATVMAAEEGTKLSEHTTESARKIALITQQQQTGTEQVTDSVNDISDLLSQLVVGSRESTEAAQDLMQLSDRLRMLVTNFKLEENY